MYHSLTRTSQFEVHKVTPKTIQKYPLVSLILLRHSSIVLIIIETLLCVKQETLFQPPLFN